MRPIEKKEKKMLVAEQAETQSPEVLSSTTCCQQLSNLLTEIECLTSAKEWRRRGLPPLYSPCSLLVSLLALTTLHCN